MYIMKDKKYIKNVILPQVKKPITYQGNELNATHKNLKDVFIRFAFAFPDLYEVGMSHLGMKILYGLLNEQPDVFCERVFAPWIDMEKLMRDKEVPLFTLETMDPVKETDILGFTIQYEMCYTNILNMLELSEIPLLSKNRTEQDPIVIAGGPCVCNPEPMANFIDLFVIGEGEEVVLELLQSYRHWKKEQRNGASKRQWLKKAAMIEGVYVPSLYQVYYHEDKTIEKIEPIKKGLPLKIRKRFIHDLEDSYYPERLIVPYAEIVHDRIPFEIFRGCGRGCRFCQAGMIYRPTRDKSVACIESGIQKLVRTTGYDEISLLSLSSGDYPQIETLIHDLVQQYEDQRISIALPSLRIDSLSVTMLEEIQKIRKSGITLAPEAGTQRMRDVINKGVTETDLIQTVREAFEKGWGHIKLYFMIGLPTETDKDIFGIAELAEKVVDQYYEVPKEKRNKQCSVVVSTSCFVPKPFTPFQWMGQKTLREFNRKQTLLKKSIKSKKIKYNWHESIVSFYEAVFARGDRQLGEVLEKAHELGCHFDGWHECFDPGKWQEAFEKTDISPEFYALRERPIDEVLPWDFIDMGISKQFLIREFKKASMENKTIFCRDGCTKCGIQEFDQGWICHDSHEI